MTADSAWMSRGALPLDTQTVVGREQLGRAALQIFLRIDAQRVISTARWEIEKAPSVLIEQVAPCFDALCSALAGKDVDHLRAHDDFMLGDTLLPEGLRDAPGREQAVRALRMALVQLQPGYRGRAYVLHGLRLLALPATVEPSADGPGGYFSHHFRDELFAGALAEALRGEQLSSIAACAYLDALERASEMPPIRLAWPAEDSLVGWKWLTEQVLPIWCGGPERVRQLLSGGHRGKRGAGSFEFGHLAGGAWNDKVTLGAVPENFDRDEARGIVDSLNEISRDVGTDRVIVASPLWMDVWHMIDTPDARIAEELTPEVRPIKAGYR
jgi:hypothetical protein